MAVDMDKVETLKERNLERAVKLAANGKITADEIVVKARLFDEHMSADSRSAARPACPRCGRNFGPFAPGEYVVICGATVRIHEDGSTELIHACEGSL